MSGTAKHRLRRRALSTALVALVASSCSSSDAGTAARAGAALPAGPKVVEVTMREYRFDYNAAIPAGRVVFVVRNAGREPHVLTLTPLPEDLPPLDAQLHGSQRRTLTPFGGVFTRQPGEDGAFAVDLVAGRRYGFICNLQTTDGRIHALEGMNSEFRAGTPPGRVPAPG